MQIEWTDSHAHLTEPAVLPELDAILLRAQAAGVRQIINICTDLACLEAGLALQARCPWIRNAGATPPHDVDREGESSFESFAQAARSRQLVAVGEVGLDYYYNHSRKETQQEFLIRYLHLARECKLPVLFHCRNAFDDLFAITDREYLSGAPAVVHCFTGTLAEAKQVVERGWMISLSGIITFKNSEALREVARWIPPESLLIETDAPFLAPQSKRGQPNEPAFICETAARLAAIRNESIEELAKITGANFERMFFQKRA